MAGRGSSYEYFRLLAILCLPEADSFELMSGGGRSCLRKRPVLIVHQICEVPLETMLGCFQKRSRADSPVIDYVLGWI